MSVQLNTDPQESRIEELTEDLPDGDWSWGKKTDKRRRKRTIVEKNNDHEIWACLETFSLYKRPTAANDYYSAPRDEERRLQRRA